LHYKKRKEKKKKKERENKLMIAKHLFEVIS